MMTNSNQNPTSQPVQSTEPKQGAWEDDECNRFIQGLELYGKDYAMIAKLVKTRNLTQVRSHHQKYMHKQETLNTKIGYQPLPVGTLIDQTQTRSKNRRQNPVPPRIQQANPPLQPAPRIQQINPPTQPAPRQQIPERPISIPKSTIQDLLIHFERPVHFNEGGLVRPGFRPITVKPVMEIQLPEIQAQMVAQPQPIGQVLKMSPNSAFKACAPKKTRKIKKDSKPQGKGRERRDQ